jgi:hypothetical protein
MLQLVRALIAAPENLPRRYPMPRAVEDIADLSERSERYTAGTISAFLKGEKAACMNLKAASTPCELLNHRRGIKSHS